MKQLIKIYCIIASIFRKVKILHTDLYKKSMSDFSAEINKMPYKADPIGGLIDNVADPETFFDDKSSNRDCDDWARQWSIWGVNNGYTATEFVVWNPSSLVKTFSTMHVVTILEKDDDFWLMNYYPYGPYDSMEDCLSYLSLFPSYKDGFDYVFSRVITPKE